MHQQMKAEREKRAQILESEGSRQAAILTAEAVRLNADAKRYRLETEAAPTPARSSSAPFATPTRSSSPMRRPGYWAPWAASRSSLTRKEAPLRPRSRTPKSSGRCRPRGRVGVRVRNGWPAPPAATTDLRGRVPDVRQNAQTALALCAPPFSRGCHLGLARGRRALRGRDSLRAGTRAASPAPQRRGSGLTGAKRATLRRRITHTFLDA